MTRFSTLKILSVCVSAAMISFIAVFLLSDFYFKRPRENPRLVTGKGNARKRAVPAPVIASASKSSKARIQKMERVPVGDTEETGDLGGPRQRAANNKAITILQIGDSHTAADFFTGAVRKILQERYGDGGPGYVIAGHPHIGVRSDTLRVSDTSGWSYKALQKSNDRAEFALAGFNAVAATQGRSMTFSSDRPLTSDMWEVELFRQPGGGSIDIRVDGVVKRSVDLDAPKVEPVVVQVDAKPNSQKLTVTTTAAGPVLLSSVSAYNRYAGLTYNSVGFPGATVDIMHKFDEKIFASELRRIAPQIVVLAFGSNEGFNGNLDLDRYAKSYRLAVSKIQAALPSARIVIIGPPDGARPGSGGEAEGRTNCSWHTPSKLNGVRAVQRDLAKSQGLVYWDWSAIMPAECGAHQWVTKSPPLMARDHLHLSRDGYQLSAEEFSKALIPIVDKIRASVNVVSNY
jgi:lysophospholipase L1-like esterase